MIELNRAMRSSQDALMSLLDLLLATEGMEVRVNVPRSDIVALNFMHRVDVVKVEVKTRRKISNENGCGIGRFKSPRNGI
jgi:hypothetical protein